MIHEAPAGRVDVVDRVGQMPEVAAAGVGFADPSCA